MEKQPEMRGKSPCRAGGSVHIPGLFLPVFALFLLRMLLLPSPAAAGDGIELTVVNRDNLSSICARYLQNPSHWREVARINHLKNANLIMPGQKLNLPIHLLRGVPVNGRALFVRSEVLIREPGTGKWHALHGNDAVRQGSSIRTKSEAAVEIVFDDGSSFYQGPDTTLDVDVSQIKGEKSLFQRLILGTGRVVMKIRRATGKDSRIEIRTPSATAVARGTEFRVTAGARDVTTSEVLHGVIDVEAMQHGVAVHEGEGTLVRRGEPPMQPRKLLEPPLLIDRQPVYRGLTFKLAFGPIPGAVSHRLVLSRDREGKDQVLERLFKTGEGATVSGLDDGAYFYRASSIDGVGLEGAFSAPDSIVVRNNPQPPFLQEPANGAALKGNSVTFRWLRVRDAASYQLQVGTDSRFGGTGARPLDVSGTSHEQPFSEPGSKFFRIRSVADDGFTGLWSDTIGFTLLPPPPSPEPEKPELDGKQIRIRWQDRGKGYTYHVQLAADASFDRPLADLKVAQPEISLERPEKGGVYHVRISSIDPEGYEGRFSPPQTFEIRSWWPYYTAGGLLGVAGIVLLLAL